MRLPADDLTARRLMDAIRKGDVVELGILLRENPALSRVTIFEKSKACGSKEFTGRSLLHIATDWPGNFPHVGAIIDLLVNAGADVGARFVGSHEETALHWAASCDDVLAIDALLAHGAELNAKGGVIGGGTPLTNATAFGQWKAARRLIEKGAETTLWDAAALGLLDRVREIFSNERRPEQGPVNAAFWGACHGGQLATAEYLLQQGADLQWVGYDHLTPLDAAIRSQAMGVAQWLELLGAKRNKS